MEVTPAPSPGFQFGDRRWGAYGLRAVDHLEAGAAEKEDMKVGLLSSRIGVRLLVWFHLKAWVG